MSTILIEVLVSWVCTEVNFMQYMYNNYISQFINNNIKSLQGSVGAHCWSLKSSAGLVCVP